MELNRGINKIDLKSGFLCNVKARDLLIFPSVIWIIAYSFMESTNFAINWNAIYGIPLRLNIICQIIVLFYAIYNAMLSEEIDKKVLYLCLILLGILTSNILFILWVALAGRSMKLWLEIGIGTVITMFALTIVCASIGIIGMGHHGAWEGNCFGMLSRGQFSFVLLFLMLQVSILRQGKYAYYEYVAMSIIVFFNSYVYKRRNANICMVLFLLILIVMEIYNRTRKNTNKCKVLAFLQKFFLDYTFIWAYGIFTVCVFSRNYIRLLEPKFPWISSLIIRFDDTAEIWRAFPPTFFGRNIREYGGTQATNLLFDPQFSRTLLFDGIIALTIMMVVSTYFMVKARQNGYWTMYAAFMVMALFSISDPVAWGIAMNFLIALPLTNWDFTKNKISSDVY